LRGTKQSQHLFFHRFYVSLLLDFKIELNWGKVRGAHPTLDQEP